MKPYRQAVMCIFLKPNGTFLIGSSPRDGGYKFPQGGLDVGETPLECLLREMEEELGILIAEGDVLFELERTVKYTYPSYKPYSEFYTGQEMFVFVVRCSETRIPTPQDDEFDELIWIKEEQIYLYDFQYRKSAYLDALDMLQTKKHLF